MDQDNIIQKLHNYKEILIIDSKRCNGLILYKRYYADFAGPGAAVGGWFDQNCDQIFPVGDISLISPKSAQERELAYKTRLQWIRQMKRITENPKPIQRAQIVLDRFENYFNPQTIEQIPDQALALLVGVFPSTIRQVRS
ncbi:MAG TPA: hypothetical protein V6C58_21510 [Allocoleopsis sp.]